jgi:hypothetical protein
MLWMNDNLENGDEYNRNGCYLVGIMSDDQPADYGEFDYEGKTWQQIFQDHTILGRNRKDQAVLFECEPKPQWSQRFEYVDEDNTSHPIQTLVVQTRDAPVGGRINITLAAIMSVLGNWTQHYTGPLHWTKFREGPPSEET